MPTIAQLNQLADSVPVLNQKAAQQAQAKQGLQQQTAVAAVPAASAGTSSVRLAQGAAPAAVEAQAAPVLAAGAQTQQELGQLGQVGLAETATKNTADQAAAENAAKTRLSGEANAQQLTQSTAEINARKRVTGAEQEAAKRLQSLGIEQDNNLQLMTIRQRQQLAALGGDVKQQVLDSRMQFERDELGRKFTNERQLADYTIANSKTEIEFKDKLREMQQTSERKIQLLQTAEARIRDAVEHGFLNEQQKLDNASKQKLIELQIAMKKKIQEEQAAAGNRAAMWQAGGMIVGAVVGGVIGSAGGPPGTALGASLGAGVGGAVGTAGAGATADGKGGSTVGF